MFDWILDQGYYSERDTSNVVRQVLEAVAYLHSLKIVHRNLKVRRGLARGPGRLAGGPGQPPRPPPHGLSLPPPRGSWRQLENLVYYNRLKNSKIVISDFHLAKLENGLIKEPCGTPEYLGKQAQAGGQRQRGDRLPEGLRVGKPQRGCEWCRAWQA